MVKGVVEPCKLQNKLSELFPRYRTPDSFLSRPRFTSGVLLLVTLAASTHGVPPRAGRGIGTIVLSIPC